MFKKSKATIQRMESESELEDDRMSGRAAHMYPDGSKYIGQWRNGKRHGCGTFVYANGGRFEGQWRDDKREGSGTLYLPDGTKYAGGWKNGEMHGKGTLYNDHGQVLFKGLWEYGEPVMSR